MAGIMKPIGADDDSLFPERMEERLDRDFASRDTNGLVPLSQIPLQGVAESPELGAAYVRFVDQNGDPLPPGSLTTIHVNTVTGDIDDITFEEA